MRIKYLNYLCNGLDSVFDSQVLELLSHISEKKVFEKVHLFLGISTELKRFQLRGRKLPPEIGVVFFKSYPNYPLFNYFLRKEISKTFKKNYKILDDAIFHTRGELLSWHLSKILDKKFFNYILPDVRGAGVEETIEFTNLSSIIKYLKTWNKRKAITNLNKFQKISVVSESLREYLVNDYSINLDNILITPCLAGINYKFDIMERNQIRTELNLTEKDDLIVFSSGSSAPWQNNSVLKILAAKEMKILNLSKDKINHKNVINKFVKYCEVPSYLNAADIAIIWRDKSVVNQVASPVKFSEYISCGLPIISNNSIDVITKYIKETQFGALLNNLNELNQEKIKILRSINRLEIAVKGANLFGIRSITEKYLTIYSSMNN